MTPNLFNALIYRAYGFPSAPVWSTFGGRKISRKMQESAFRHFRRTDKAKRDKHIVRITYEQDQLMM